MCFTPCNPVPGRGASPLAHVSASPKTRWEMGRCSHSLSLNGAPSLVESTVNDLNGDPGTRADRKRPSPLAPALSFLPVIRACSGVLYCCYHSVRMQRLARPYHSVTQGQTRRMSPGLSNQVERLRWQCEAGGRIEALSPFF